MNNRTWWKTKLARNQDRDKEIDSALKDAEWTVLRVWEHEGSIEAANRVEAVVRSRLDELRKG